MIGAPTYFAQFGFGDWFQSATLLSYFLSHPDAIYGVTWFLVPLIVFQLLGTLSYGLMRRRELPCCLLMTVGFMALFWAVGRFPGCFGILSYLQYLPVLLSGCILYWYRRECFSRKSAGMLLALTFTVFLALCRRCSPDRFSVPESIPPLSPGDFLQFFKYNPSFPARKRPPPARRRPPPFRRIAPAAPRFFPPPAPGRPPR